MAGFGAVVLAGGRGRRLAPVSPWLPKALVPIGSIPLLALQLSKLSLGGCLEAVVVGGYGIHLVRNVLTAFSPSLDVFLVEDTSGTLPAVLTGLAAIKLLSGHTVVLNADTIVDVDLSLCLEAAPAWATVTAVLTGLPTGQNEGTVFLGPTGRVLAFEETHCPDADGISPGPGSSELWSSGENSVSLNNCGVYVVDREQVLLDGPGLEALGSSWERHALVHYRRCGLLGGLVPPVQYVLDVGTPPRYEQACADASLIHQMCGYRRDGCESHSRLA